MASISKVELWEDVAGNVIGLVFDPAGQPTNAVQNLGAQQPLPRPALVEAARQAFPFAPTYDPHAFGERSLADLYTYLKAYNHHIADIFPDDPTALYPERATPAGLQFLIRWMF
jgi:hypothetical protein